MVHERRICLTCGGRGRIETSMWTSVCRACAKGGRPADVPAARSEHGPAQPDRTRPDNC
jgi:hypothetical protein